MVVGKGVPTRTAPGQHWAWQVYVVSMVGSLTHESYVNTLTGAKDRHAQEEVHARSMAAALGVRQQLQQQLMMMMATAAADGGGSDSDSGNAELLCVEKLFF